MLRQVAYNIVAVMECVVCTLIKVCFRQAQPRLHVQVTGGALGPRDTHLRHQVIVWPGQGRQSDCLIHSSHICLALSSVFARCTDPDDVIALPCGGVRLKHLCHADDIGQLNSDVRTVWPTQEACGTGHQWCQDKEYDF